jgi:protoporphyrinogen oxidase
LKYDVKSICRDEQNWIISDGKNDKCSGEIVSTMPIQRLISALDAPKTVKIAAAELKYNSLITVLIGIRKNKINDLSWLYIPEKYFDSSCKLSIKL